MIEVDVVRSSAGLSGNVEIVNIQASCSYVERVFLFLNLKWKAGGANHERDMRRK
jgi:hypothetical protein